MIDQLISKYNVLVIDGPLATQLERKGCDLDDALWSARILMEDPRLIREVHETYFRAGADVAITASYQAGIASFMDRGSSEGEARELIYLSVRLACEARDAFLEMGFDESVRPMPMVAGSVGSYGAFLADGSEYRGNFTLSREELMDFHRPRMEVLCNRQRAHRVDFLAMETIPCIEEAQALAALLEEFPQMQAWLSFSALDGAHISQGQAIEEAAAFLDRQDQVFAIGVNCTHPDHIQSLVRKIKTKTNKPVVVYPNSGEIYKAHTGEWHGSGRQLHVNDLLKKWYNDGARLIGGCCRTDPGLIRELDAWRRDL